jgi:transmembrane sensor
VTKPTVEQHIEAARSELRRQAWTPQRVEAAWRELQGRRATDDPFRRAKAVAGAALAVAALCALAIVGWRWLGPASAVPNAAGDATGLQRLALGDQTEVRFDRQTDLEVREQSESRVVVVLKAGTGHFRVRHDPERVFRVQAGAVAVEDLGTTFDVANEGGSVRVSVKDGSVGVSYPDAGGALKKATLLAGDSGVYPSVAPPPSAEPAQPTASPPTPASSADRSPGVHGDWRELARAGKHGRAYELLAAGNMRDVRDEPGDLLLASDAARRSRHPAEAARLLRKLLTNHEKDPRAPAAAFTLGWLLMSDLGRPRDAALAFERAEALAPRGNLAEDAFARSVEAWHRAGDRSRATAGVERYRKAYPRGRHLGMLEQLVGAP